jgi:diguanylate cyclase (GGDEF)-like protein/PAS domain S-box-containing protein
VAEEYPTALLYLPYLALIAGYATMVSMLGGLVTSQAGGLVVGALLLTVLVLVRQELVLRENSRLLAQSARRTSEARFRSLASNATDAITLVDANGIVTDATDAVQRVLGVDPSRLIGRPLVTLAHADDQGRLTTLIRDAADRRPTPKPMDWRLWDNSGVWRQVETVAANLIDDPSVGQIVLTTRDVRERKALEQRLAQVALHDPLTGLPNRALFVDRVDHALATNGPAGRETVVLVVDIDGFKRLNSGLGHALGDRVLNEISDRIESVLAPGETVARLGGDEFGVLLAGDGTLAGGRARADRIAAVVQVPVELPQTTAHVSVRIGIAAAATLEGGAAALVRRASVAIDHARSDGRAGTTVFEPGMQQSVQDTFELESDLRRALEGDELLLQYQPIFDLITGELVSAEALVRWDHPIRGRLGPSVFIPVAEAAGLIDSLGNWVLRAACREVARWPRLARGRVPRVAVNLSPHHVADPNLPWLIQATLAEAGAVPAWLSVEVTENLVMDNTAATLERLHAIRSLGIGVAIDDFGTGYSSLAYLQDFPMSHLKIDRSFVTPLDDPSREPGVVRAVVEIGRALGMTTVAEGIETITQLERLRALGCELGQGFLLGRPMDAKDIRRLIAKPGRPDWATRELERTA